MRAKRVKQGDTHINVRIGLGPKAALRAYCEEHDVKISFIVSRLVRAFLRSIDGGSSEHEDRIEEDIIPRQGES